MTPEALDALVAAGASAEMIAAAWKAEMAREGERSDARRAKDAERKRRERGTDAESTLVRECPRDIADNAGPLPTPSLSSPQTPQQTHPHLPGKTNSTRVKGNRIPDDFAMPDDWLAWAVSDRGWSRSDAEDEAEAFTDYWRAKAGRDGVKLDWPATWRNWCRNSRRNTRQHPARKPVVPL